MNVKTEICHFILYYYIIVSSQVLDQIKMYNE